jgi:3-hydroxymyristoyl/3-hydroxydecanoyl-(acyl carrier protein) dehydratase
VIDKDPTEAAAKPLLPQHADTLLPHKPPMLLVEALVQRRGNGAVALTTLPIAGLFVKAGGILPEYFIELIAQTAALGNCYDALMHNMATRDGMLVGIDVFSWPGRSQPGMPVYIETDIAFTFGAMKVVHGEVYAGKELLATGDIKVWQDLGKEAKNRSQVPKVIHPENGSCSLSAGVPMMGRDDDSLYAAMSVCCLELRLVSREERRLEGSADFRFPADFAGFQGHFPGNPILPAIVQPAMGRFLADWSLGQRTWPTLFRKIKFKGSVRPGDQVTVSMILKKDGERWGAMFSLKRPDGEAVAGGIMDFAF